MPSEIGEQYFAWLPDWLLIAGIVAVTIALALVVHAAAQRVVITLGASRHPMFNALVRRTKGLTRYAVVLFALSLVMPLLPLEPATTATANRIFVAGVILLIGWVVLLVANASADYYVGQFEVGVADDLVARKAVTQMNVLKRIMDGLIIVIAIGFALMSFDSVRQVGVSLFASAGVVGIIAGVSLRPILANFFAGLQIALTQPIRINDVVIVENEYGSVEEISSTYVVVRIWDLRRLIVPLSYFMEKPFQNWTRTSPELLGTAYVYADYTVDVEDIRKRGCEIAEASELWDRRVFNVQVTDVKESTLEIRVLVSAADSGKLWGLRCEMREKLMAFIQSEHPDALPRRRLEGSIERLASRNDGEARPVDMASSSRSPH